MGHTTQHKRCWISPVPPVDDFEDPIKDEFIDGRSKMGPWGLMTPASWAKFGVGQLGTGFGQRYKLQPNGQWLKVEG